jgi:hypothetical protein
MFLKIQPLSLWQDNCTSGGVRRAKGGAPMPPTLVTSDWRKLSKAVRKERNPIEFIYLLKRLYDVVNEDEEKRAVRRKAKLRRPKRERVEHERAAA